MNFFWKIFISIILITVIFFSIGSGYLITSVFNYTLSKEIESSYSDNIELKEEVKRSLVMTKSPIAPGNSSVLYNKQIDSEGFWSIIKNIVSDRNKKSIAFRISDSKYESLCENNWIELDENILFKVLLKEESYNILEVNGSYYVYTVSDINFEEENFYIENYRDITLLYKSRSRQYKICFFIIIAMIIAASVVAGIVSRFLTKPIRVLADVTRDFASGDLSKRSNIYYKDEIGLLSEEFNNMADKLQNTIAELRDVAVRKEVFVGNFTHELKTPLTSIIGYSDMLRSKKMTQENVVLSANYIFEESRRLEALSMKLMELIVLKKQDFNKINIPVKSLFESVEGAIFPILKKENIKFSSEYDDDSVCVESDLIKTVFVNLLDNARKSIIKGGEITMIGKSLCTGYEIVITDNGRGMEEKELNKITEAFYMIDKSRARKQGGAGLGLAICNEIIELHKGSIIFESKLNLGTSVKIILHKNS